MSIKIYKITQYGEIQIGLVEGKKLIAIEGTKHTECGYIDESKHLIRTTQHGEQDLGYFTAAGEIISNGLFEGGSLGWLDDEGFVIQGGMILGEEEVGRVEATADGSDQDDGGTDSDQMIAAAAALLLHFLPLDAEEQKRMARR